MHRRRFLDAATPGRKQAPLAVFQFPDIRSMADYSLPENLHSRQQCRRALPGDISGQTRPECWQPRSGRLLSPYQPDTDPDSAAPSASHWFLSSNRKGNRMKLHLHGTAPEPDQVETT
jgi:hypothetical protein